VQSNFKSNFNRPAWKHLEYLLDTKHHVKYTVAVDDTRHPIAGKHTGQNEYIFVGPKQTLTTWAKFQAPPEDVDKVTVSIPGAPPFEDVPISKQAFA
ncbi:MAG: hypothetical protein ACRERV_09945, partial [Methylococcales bacterium]